METCTICNTPYPSEFLTEFDDELLCHNWPLSAKLSSVMTAASVSVSTTTPERRIFRSA